MKVVLAKTAGFCFGVNRAVEILDKTVAENKKVYTLGEIIHNSYVVEKYRKKGAVVEENPENIEDGSVVVIRSHGVGKEIFDALTEKNCKIVDATCPFVKKIHNVVEKYQKKSYNIIVVGNKCHPEVTGILGWCGNLATVVSEISDLEQIKGLENVCVVSQTTFNKDKYKKLVELIKENTTNCEVIDTICDATSNRQEEVANMSKECDAIVVVGGKASSNTKKLAEVAAENCKNVYLIESKDELCMKDKHFSCVGVSAGASTPANIIKEVVDMLEKNEMNFEEALENTLKPLNNGDVVKGTVIKITPTEVYVNLDAKADGIIPVDQVTIKPNVSVEDVLSVGQEIEAFVVRVNDVDGYVTLSMSKLEAMEARKHIDEAYETKASIEGVVTDVVRGGIIVQALGARIFVPASQASDKRNVELETLLKKTVTLRIIDLDKRRNKIVGSIRVLLSEEKKQKAEAFWASIEVGQEIKGVVKSVTDFGAFVDIGGVDGLVHVSELTWDRFKRPSEIVKPGDFLDVKVLSFDKETRKISLGHKKAEDDPWKKLKETVNVDDVVECKVVRLFPFGAFAEIIPGVDGLIHISQICKKRIATPADVLAVGDVVQAKVVEISDENQRVGLSIRALEEETAEEVVEEAPVEETAVEEVAVEEAAEVVEAPVEEAVAETTEEAAVEETTEE